MKLSELVGMLTKLGYPLDAVEVPVEDGVVRVTQAKLAEMAGCNRSFTSTIINR